MEAVSSKSWSRLHSPRVSVFSSRKQSLSIGRVGFCPRKWSYNNCLRMKINGPTSMGNSIQSFKGRSVRAQASAELELVDVDEIRQRRSLPHASSGSILPYVFGVGGVIAVAFFAAKAVEYVVLSQRITAAGVAARALVVAANVIGTTLAYSLLDKLLLPKSFSRMLGTARGRSIFSNITSSDDVDTFARFVTLKAAGISQEQAQVLAEEVKGLSKSKFDSLVANIRLHQQHEKETKALRADMWNQRIHKVKENICKGIFWSITILIGIALPSLLKDLINSKGIFLSTMILIGIFYLFIYYYFFFFVKLKKK